MIGRKLSPLVVAALTVCAYAELNGAIRQNRTKPVPTVDPDSRRQIDAEAVARAQAKRDRKNAKRIQTRNPE